MNMPNVYRCIAGNASYSVEAKDQVGLELQQIADGVVYIDGIDGRKWICCQKCKKIYHVVCVCPNQPQHQLAILIAVANVTNS